MCLMSSLAECVDSHSTYKDRVTFNIQVKYHYYLWILLVLLKP
jgi:uncharacterized membrane protein YjgN (DUF898 family)